ncbi:MAG: nucleotidyl transferase AbiEii/AbiGii toxin family protein [Alphaproteobacteria bacterium]|nr:nucleotidyl transferase AbiEii/AbiGii toxin family protein [Alphaproteobacteria bacterium]
MPQFIDLNRAEKNEIILRVSSHLKIAPVLVEKDFWVSWLLNKIFQQDFSKDITFKGGTSLSKCFGIISRFSEDLDLTINRDIFNGGQNNQELSRNALEKLIDSHDKLASAYVTNTFKPILEKAIRVDLKDNHWQLVPDENEPKNLRFIYPSIIKTFDNPYVKQSVLIELGVRGEITPFEVKTVNSFIDDVMADILETEASLIRTLSPNRTFWEKITLLHAENNRPQQKLSGDRLSRHYYDVHQLVEKGVADVALQDLSLLRDVIEHKKKYFRAGWAKYEEAVPGSLRIYPHNNLKKELVEDYKQMEQMIFDTIHSFNEILEAIKNFEETLNCSPTIN